MLADIHALEQFARQIARGQGAEEIGDRQSNQTCYPENHGCTSTLYFQPVII